MTTMTASQKRGCVGRDPDNPKRQCATPEEAEEHLWYIVDRFGTSPKILNVFGCRYAPKGEPHWHVGHLQGEGGRRRTIDRWEGNPRNRRGRRR